MNGEVELHDYQAKAFESEARFIGLIAGTGGGKTFFGPIWLLREVRNHPTDSFFVIAPTFPLFNRTTLPEFRRRFDYEPGIKGEYKEQKREYRLGSGGIVYFGSADRPDSLEGGQVRACWTDEAGQIKLASWQAIQRRLGVKMGRCLLTTTPYSLNWLKTEFFDRWKKGDPDYDVVQFSSIDNPYYPQQEYERAGKTLDRRIFEMRYMGLFRKMAGLVYVEFTNRNIKEPKGVEFKRVIGGIDWGFYPDPAAIILHGEDSQGRVWIFYEYYELRKTPDEICEKAKKLKEDYKVETFWCGQDEPGSIEMLRRAGLDARANEVKSVAEGQGAVTALIKNQALFVSKKCPNWLDEVETHHYPEGKDKPEGPNHALDASRYAIVNMKAQVQPEFWVVGAGGEEEKPVPKTREEMLKQRYGEDFEEGK